MAAAQGNYRRDLAQEALFSDFLDLCLYQPITEILQLPERLVSFQRVTDLDMQHAGIDVVYRHRGLTIFIDEKSQLHNLNREIPTFAFELSYLKRGEERTGWLLDKRKKTHGYMLCWPRGERDDYGDIYLGAKVIFLAKKQLLSYLTEHGYNEMALQRKAGELRLADTPGRHLIGNPDFWFYLTQPKAGGLYRERMINVVVRAEQLESISTAALDVSLDRTTSQVQLVGRWGSTMIDECIAV